MGLHQVADIDGGFEAWQQNGLPVTYGDFDVRM
ncbi:3-mercaptopyruvate sulfurtransferase SseA [Micrococcus sp. TA1]|nr:3-mercaptopyruvate sulfurtransferase SseA [Micrococcus sp. TA1]